MKPNNIYIVVAGYAFSGKTTLQRQLESIGFPVDSASSVLDSATLEYFQVPDTLQNRQILINKDERGFILLTANTDAKVFTKIKEALNLDYSEKVTIRHAKIYVAEHVIVPNETRGYFTSRCLKKVNSLPGNFKVIFSTIEEERQILYKQIREDDLGDILKVNLERKLADSTVDTRSLHKEPNDTVYNNNTKRKLFVSFMNILSYHL